MNLSGDKNDNLVHEKTLAEQGVGPETVLALDIRSGANYHLKVRINDEGEQIELPYNFNDSVEKLRNATAQIIQLNARDLTLKYNGRVLEDDFKVYQYGILINDTLSL